MHTNIITFVTLTLSTLSTATPAPRKEPSTTLTPDQVLHVAPKSESCTNPPAKGECATAEQAARNIALSFDTYGVSSRAEQAAVIALMAFESEEFRYSRSHFPEPGVEGKGSTFLSPCIQIALHCIQNQSANNDSPQHAIPHLQREVRALAAQHQRQSAGHARRQGPDPRPAARGQGV